MPSIPRNIAKRENNLDSLNATKSESDLMITRGQRDIIRLTNAIEYTRQQLQVLELEYQRRHEEIAQRFQKRVAELNCREDIRAELQEQRKTLERQNIKLQDATQRNTKAAEDTDSEQQQILQKLSNIRKQSVHKIERLQQEIKVLEFQRKAKSKIFRRLKYENKQWEQKIAEIEKVQAVEAKHQGCVGTCIRRVTLVGHEPSFSIRSSLNLVTTEGESQSIAVSSHKISPKSQTAKNAHADTVGSESESSSSDDYVPPKADGSPTRRAHVTYLRSFTVGSPRSVLLSAEYSDDGNIIRHPASMFAFKNTASTSDVYLGSDPEHDRFYPVSGVFDDHDSGECSDTPQVYIYGRDPGIGPEDDQQMARGANEVGVDYVHSEDPDSGSDQLSCRPQASGHPHGSAKSILQYKALQDFTERMPQSRGLFQRPRSLVRTSKRDIRRPSAPSEGNRENLRKQKTGKFSGYPRSGSRPHTATIEGCRSWRDDTSGLKFFIARSD